MSRIRLLAVLVGVATLPACSSSGGSTVARASRPPAVASGAAQPDPNFDYGYMVLITPAGVRPHWLVANCCQPITWSNHTGAPTSVVFDRVGGGSGPIPVGGTFVFTPSHVESIAYHVGTDQSRSGVVQVNQTAE